MRRRQTIARKVADDDKDLLRGLIQGKGVSLPPQQRRLAELLMQHPEKVVFGTLRSVSDWSGVSTLTVLRFAKTLGFKGYHALQAAAREAYAPVRGNESSDHTDAVAQLLAEQAAELREVGARIRPEELDDICRLLASANRVYICSTEPAAALARVLSRRLFYAGIASDVLSPADLFTMFSHRAPHKRDVTIGVHLWLLFLDVYRVIEFAKAKGAKTVVFAGSPVSPLWRLSDYYLYAHTETGRPYSSWTPMVALFEIVTARLIERDPSQAEQIYQAFREQAKKEHFAIGSELVSAGRQKARPTATSRRAKG